MKMALLDTRHKIQKQHHIRDSRFNDCVRPKFTENLLWKLRLGVVNPTLGLMSLLLSMDAISEALLCGPCVLLDSRVSEINCNSFRPTDALQTAGAEAVRSRLLDFSSFAWNPCGSSGWCCWCISRDCKKRHRNRMPWLAKSCLPWTSSIFTSNPSTRRCTFSISALLRSTSPRTSNTWSLIKPCTARLSSRVLVTTSSRCVKCFFVEESAAETFSNCFDTLDTALDMLFRVTYMTSPHDRPFHHK